MNYTMTINEQFNSIEISFAEKPSAEIREALKALKYRWHGVKKIWYGYSTEEEAKAAIEGKTASAAKAEPKATKKAEKPQAVNKFGVQVGDIFHSSWGYEQTNNDFFQVVELVGSSSVRVREVCPELVSREAMCGMSEDRVFSISREMLPPSPYSVFINDQEKGDLKRLKSYYADGSHPCFTLGSFASADLLPVGDFKCYESWYY